MKVTWRLVERAKLIRKKHRETEFIFSTWLIGGMVFCNETYSEVSRKSTID